jgi:cold-inducible RNA-binding protein
LVLIDRRAAAIEIEALAKELEPIVARRSVPTPLIESLAGWCNGVRAPMMNIYVGNLSYGMSEDELRQAFAAHGEVSSVKILMDRETGRSRGFGFVEMPNKAEADAAIAQLNGKDVGGRALRINEARPRERR